MATEETIKGLRLEVIQLIRDHVDPTKDALLALKRPWWADNQARKVQEARDAIRDAMGSCEVTTRVSFADGTTQEQIAEYANGGPTPPGAIFERETPDGAYLRALYTVRDAVENFRCRIAGGPLVEALPADHNLAPHYPAAVRFVKQLESRIDEQRQAMGLEDETQP